VSDATQNPTPDKGQAPVAEAPVDEALVLNHDYDGIQEYDNPLPGWWKALFLASILFSALYYAFFNSEKFSVAAEYEREHGALVELAASANLLEGISNESLSELARDAAAMEAAKAKFVAVCASCHGNQGEGKIGPNLTDNVWIHCSEKTDVYLTIYRGVPAKGMIEWGKTLKPEEIQRLAAYVLSLQGTDPPNPRAPEGDESIPF